MAAAASCAGVAGVRRRVVDDPQMQRIERGEPFAQNGFKRFEIVRGSDRHVRSGVGHAGNTRLKGLTVTLA